MRHLERQAFSSELIDQGHQPELAGIVGPGLYEVVGPDMIAPSGPQSDVEPIVEPEPTSWPLFLGYFICRRERVRSRSERADPAKPGVYHPAPLTLASASYRTRADISARWLTRCQSRGHCHPISRIGSRLIYWFEEVPRMQARLSQHAPCPIPPPPRGLAQSQFCHQIMCRAHGHAELVCDHWRGHNRFAENKIEQCRQMRS